MISRVLALGVATVLMTALPASAQSFAVSASGGLGVPVDDIAEVRDAGLSLAGALEAVVSDHLRLGADVSWSEFPVDQAELVRRLGDPEASGLEVEGGDASALVVLAAGRWLFLEPRSPVRPFVHLGVGWESVSVDEGRITLDGQTVGFSGGDQDGFAVSVGAGGSYRLTSRLAGFVEGRLLLLDPDGGSSSEFVPIRAGLEVGL